MAAASAGHASVVTLLINRGADVNIPGNVSHLKSTIFFIVVKAKLLKSCFHTHNLIST
jgi:Ankyrin repeat